LENSGRAAFLFPGLGSQSAGMGIGLAETDSGKAVLQTVDDALGWSISAMLTDPTPGLLDRPSIAHPGIFAVSIAEYASVAQQPARSNGSGPSFVAGHSLGLFAAITAARSLDTPTGAYLVYQQGLLMEEAASENRGGMGAIVGLDVEAVESLCSATGAEISHTNGPDQIIVSAESTALEKTMETAQTAGAWAKVLHTDGLFHHSDMKDAREKMRQLLREAEISDPEIPVVRTTTVQPARNAGEIRDEILAQFCETVRWHESISYMSANGVTDFVEIGPGQVLTKLMNRSRSRADLKTAR
jgi:[acyl-carrier-protein] S-malonyltransferase